MKDDACIRFLQWALPRLHMRWPGFRKVRNQVCKRLARRLTALDLPDGDAYRRYLSDHPDEWQVLDSLCRPVVTRFYRDTRVFERLSDDILPGLASAAQSVRRDTLTAWSIGSASGEEPYNPGDPVALSGRSAFSRPEPVHPRHRSRCAPVATQRAGLLSRRHHQESAGGVAPHRLQPAWGPVLS